MRRACVLLVSVGLLVAACAEDDDTPLSTAGAEVDRDSLRGLSGYFGHVPTDAELGAGFVVTVPGSTYDDLVAVRPDLGGVPETTADERRSGDLTISVLRASTGDFRAPRCPPSVVDEDGCPTVRGDTVVQIRFADGTLSRGVWTWSETGTVLESLRPTVAAS